MFFMYIIWVGLFEGECLDTALSPVLIRLFRMFAQASKGSSWSFSIRLVKKTA